MKHITELQSARAEIERLTGIISQAMGGKEAFEDRVALVMKIGRLRAALEAFTTHFVIKDGPNKDTNQYGHLQLWCAVRSVNEEPSAANNPWMLIGDAQNSYSLAHMGMMAGALNNARTALGVGHQQIAPDK